MRRRWLAPALSAAVTAALIFGVGLIQKARDGWPFDEPAPVVASPAVRTSTAKAAGQQDRAPVQVDAPTAARLGIRVERVASQDLVSSFEAVATVALDESRLSQVHTRVSGWVEQLLVNTTGQAVRAGQPVARIFSQELLSSQTEYLAARRFAALGLATGTVTSGRTRLRVLGMSDGEIATLERTGHPLRLVGVTAPRSGVVINLGVSVGTAVDPSTVLMILADTSNLWAFAEVPEAALPFIHVGTPARLDFPVVGISSIQSRVEFAYPTLSEQTRTLRMRLPVPNRSGVLVPGVYGTATFEMRGGRGITVPREAVIDTGRRQHVFVVRGTMFEPRRVVLGARIGERIVVREGLVEGELVATSGTFMLDSESRLRATGGGRGHEHGSMASESRASPEAAAPHAEPGRHQR